MVIDLTGGEVVVLKNRWSWKTENAITGQGWS